MITDRGFFMITHRENFITLFGGLQLHGIGPLTSEIGNHNEHPHTHNQKAIRSDLVNY